MHLGDPLERLPCATKAPFNAYGKEDDPFCLPDTRVEVLERVRAWAVGDDTRHIFWLSGLAGTGKSTIARTVAQEYYNKRRLGASFFFSRGGGDVGDASKFFTSIAVQLANNIQPLRRYICEAILERGDIATQSLRDQWRQLILGPLLKLDSNPRPMLYILAVDALDECDDQKHIQIILQLLAEARLLKRVRLRVFLTSRPETPIRYGFHQIPETEHQDFVLQNISPDIVDHDISLFLEHNLRLIRQQRSLDAGWPGEHVVKCLVQNASGLFIWAATACRFIHEGKQFAAKRLATILKGSNTSATTPEMHLDQIYTTVLKNSISPGYLDEEKEELYSMLRHLLGSIVVLLSPLSAYSLSSLLHVQKQDFDQTFEDLHAILDIPEDQTHPLRLHHPSFRDFLLNETRCGNRNFLVDEKEAHWTLVGHCIKLMSTTLKRDICNLKAPGTLTTEVDRDRVQQCLSPEVQYACIYWVQHIQRSSAQLVDNNIVHQFLQEHFLHWLEALSLIGKTSEGVLAIISLESCIHVSHLT